MESFKGYKKLEINDNKILVIKTNNGKIIKELEKDKIQKLKWIYSFPLKEHIGYSFRYDKKIYHFNINENNDIIAKEFFDGIPFKKGSDILYWILLTFIGH